MQTTESEVPTTSESAPTTSIGTTEPASSSTTGEPSDSTGAAATANTTGTPSECGNAVLEPGEECDDGPGDALDGCDSSCKRSALFVFVTSQVFVGSNLSLATAQGECETLGAVALGPQFAPSFGAWFSAAGLGNSAAETLQNPNKLPYLRLDHAQVSAYPLGPDLFLPISVDETGADASSVGEGCANPDALVWTMSTPKGALATECAGNTRNKGTVGTLNAAGPEWSQACIYDCAIDARLYCVETIIP